MAYIAEKIISWAITTRLLVFPRRIINAAISYVISVSRQHRCDYLKEYSNVHFYKGIFPFTAKLVEGKVFSLVNLDVDLYESTLSCLNFFYPRMSKGGVVILHDYTVYQGVRKAVDEFFDDKQETIIELYGSQCLIVKF